MPHRWSSTHAFWTVVLVGATVVSGCSDEPTPTALDAALPLTAAAEESEAPGFKTSEPLQARMAPGVRGTLTALATVGDAMPGSGLPLAPIPDGIGIWNDDGMINLMMNHELSSSGVDGQFQFSRVSRMEIDPNTLKILTHSYPIDGSEGYNRLCSAEWVDTEDGFPGGYYFTGEETDDGRQLALDAEGTIYEMPHLGRYAHENQVSVPGFPNHAVVLNFDDNGGRGVGRAGAISELYMYAAATSQDVIAGNGALYVWAADDSSLDPSDLAAGDAIHGSWVEVPQDIAQDYQALEAWVDQDDVLAFPFIRLEDGFYDKRPGRKGRAFFFDTGRSSITDESGAPLDPWGSIYAMEFDDLNNPMAGATLILLARSTGTNMWASPDNGDMNANGFIMLQEDPANGPWTRRPAIWQLKLRWDGTLRDPVGRKVVELVDPNDPNDETLVYGNESSGIVDASEFLGWNSWIFDTQSHDMAVPSLGLTRQNGQLIVLKVK